MLFESTITPTLRNHGPLLVAFGLVAYGVLWVIYARALHPLSKIPGPWLASVSRLWIVLQIRRGDMEHTQRALHRKYGPLIRIAPNEVACSDPEAIKQIYRTQGPLTKTDFYPTWGNSTISKYPDNFSGTDEKLHSERRKIVNHVYSLSNVLQSEEYIDTCSNLFMQRFSKFANTGEEIDLGEWLQWYAFDVIGELYFGQMFGFMEHSHDHKNYIHSLDTLLPVLCVAANSASYMRTPIFMSAICIPSVKRALKAIDQIADAARECVARRIQVSGEANNRRDILHQLLEIKETKGEKVDFGVHEVEYEAYVGLFAGSDTTAIAMRSILYHLIRDPITYQGLQEEIDQATARGELSNPVRFAEAIKLPLLCACIKEGMRLHPSVGLTMPRLSPAGGLKLSGHYIPEGFRVGMNAAVIQRDIGVFGSDADQFRPQRWIDGDVKEMDKCMLNFGAGTRTCIGKNISLSEMHKLIPQVLRTFDLKLVDINKEWQTNNLWFNKQSGIYVQVKRRKLSNSDI